MKKIYIYILMGMIISLNLKAQLQPAFQIAWQEVGDVVFDDINNTLINNDGNPECAGIRSCNVFEGCINNNTENMTGSILINFNDQINVDDYNIWIGFIETSQELCVTNFHSAFNVSDNDFPIFSKIFFGDQEIYGGGFNLSYLINYEYTYNSITNNYSLVVTFSHAVPPVFGTKFTETIVIDECLDLNIGIIVDDNGQNPDVEFILPDLANAPPEMIPPFSELPLDDNTCNCPNEVTPQDLGEIIICPGQSGADMEQIFNDLADDYIEQNFPNFTGINGFTWFSDNELTIEYDVPDIQWPSEVCQFDPQELFLVMHCEDNDFYLGEVSFTDYRINLTRTIIISNEQTSFIPPVLDICSEICEIPWVSVTCEEPQPLTVLENVLPEVINEGDFGTSSWVLNTDDGNCSIPFNVPYYCPSLCENPIEPTWGNMINATLQDNILDVENENVSTDNMCAQITSDEEICSCEEHTVFAFTPSDQTTPPYPVYSIALVEEGEDCSTTIEKYGFLFSKPITKAQNNIITFNLLEDGVPVVHPNFNQTILDFYFPDIDGKTSCNGNTIENEDVFKIEIFSGMVYYSFNNNIIYRTRCTSQSSLKAAIRVHPNMNTVTQTSGDLFSDIAMPNNISLCGFNCPCREEVYFDNYLCENNINNAISCSTLNCDENGFIEFSSPINTEGGTGFALVGLKSEYIDPCDHFFMASITFVISTSTSTMYIDGNSFIINGSEIFKIALEDGMFNYYIDNINIYTESSLCEGSEKLQFGITLTANMSGPEEANTCGFDDSDCRFKYAILKKKLDGSYYDLGVNDLLNFKYDEKYFTDEESIEGSEFVIYDICRNIMKEGTFKNEEIEINHHANWISMSVNFDEEPCQIATEDYFTLEVTNSKKEMWMLRFKKD